MISFSQFLTEEAAEGQGKKLKHLTHLEDMHIHGGNQGVSDAADILDDVNKNLTGKKSKTKVSVKYDGAPSIVFGHHPKTGQFFVASKSAFNKNPKINYTEEDIQRNHGHAPGLVEKLSAALKHLPKVAPKKGVYQGDLMYTKGDVEEKDGKYHFTPNTITYSTPKNSAHGKSIKNSKLGVVVHTKYEGRHLEDMSATPDVDRENFKHHPDVHNIDPTLKTDSSHYTPDQQKEFRNHLEAAKATYSKMKPEALDALNGHSTDLEAHINSTVRDGTKPSAAGYIEHLNNKMKKDVEGVKTEAAKQKKMQNYSDRIAHVAGNKKAFDQALELHHHMQQAKNVLTDAMSKATDFEHSVQGEKTGPEGFVANRNGNMAKFVKRDEFSRLNFLKGKMQQQKKTEE